MLTAIQEESLSPKISQKESLKSQNEILKKIKLVKNSQEIIQRLEQCQNLQSCGSQKKIEKFTDLKYSLKFLEIWEEMDGNLSNFLDFERVYARFKENLENQSTKDVVCNVSSRKESLHYLYAKELEFLKNQRISSLKRGAWFQDLQDNYSVFRLSEDEQYLYFQEYSTKVITKQEIPSIDELHSLVKVEDISVISLEKTSIGKSYAFSISGFDHEFMQEEFECFFLTNSSTQFVEWYEGLCILTGKSIFSLETDLPLNGKDVASILNKIESCIDSKPILKPQIIHEKADLPNFDFFYTDI